MRRNWPPPSGTVGSTPPARRKPAGHPEDDLQGTLIQYFALAVHPKDAILFAIPNGEKRDAAVAARLSGLSAKQRDLLDEDAALRPAGQGVLPGASDLVLLLPGPRTVLIEVKIPEILAPGSGMMLAGGRLPKEVLHEAGRLSKAQKRFRMGVERLDQDYRVVRSLEDFVALLRSLGVPARAGVMGMR